MIFAYYKPLLLNTTRFRDNNTVICFSQTQNILLFLTYWRQVSVFRPSSGHLYIKFKTDYM